MSGKHLRLASSTVAAINRLENGDEREAQFAVFGKLFGGSGDKELARYGKKLAKKPKSAATEEDRLEAAVRLSSDGADDGQFLVALAKLAAVAGRAVDHRGPDRLRDSRDQNGPALLVAVDHSLFSADRPGGVCVSGSAAVAGKAGFSGAAVESEELGRADTDSGARAGGIDDRSQPVVAGRRAARRGQVRPRVRGAIRGAARRIQGRRHAADAAVAKHTWKPAGRRRPSSSSPRSCRKNRPTRSFNLRCSRPASASHQGNGDAETLFKELVARKRSEGPRYYYAEHLLRNGRRDEATSILKDILHQYRRGTVVWRFQERKWYYAAKRLLKSKPK